MDDGRLTDGHGRTVDFKNTILIMTSNVGTQWITDVSSSQEEEMRRRVMEALKASFKPEFFNRVYDIIIFHKLTKDQIKKIVDIQTEFLKKRLTARNISVSLTEKAKEYLVKKGFDPIYGARPLKRVIQKDIQDVLALKILNGEFKEGDSITIDANDIALEFKAA